MKTKILLLPFAVIFALTISTKIMAQEILLPLTENSELRPKVAGADSNTTGLLSTSSMLSSSSLSTTSLSSAYVYATYNQNYMSVYLSNYRGTATVTIEDVFGNVYEWGVKSIKGSGVISLPVFDLPDTYGFYVIRVVTSNKSYYAYFTLL